MTTRHGKLPVKFSTWAALLAFVGVGGLIVGLVASGDLRSAPHHVQPQPESLRAESSRPALKGAQSEDDGLVVIGEPSTGPTDASAESSFTGDALVLNAPHPVALDRAAPESSSPSPDPTVDVVVLATSNRNGIGDIDVVVEGAAGNACGCDARATTSAAGVARLVVCPDAQHVCRIDAAPLMYHRYAEYLPEPKGVPSLPRGGHTEIVFLVDEAPPAHAIVRAIDAATGEPLAGAVGRVIVAGGIHSFAPNWDDVVAARQGTGPDGIVLTGRAPAWNLWAVEIRHIDKGVAFGVPAMRGTREEPFEVKLVEGARLRIPFEEAPGTTSIEATVEFDIDPLVQWEVSEPSREFGRFRRIGTADSWRSIDLRELPAGVPLDLVVRVLPSNSVVLAARRSLQPGEVWAPKL